MTVRLIGLIAVFIAVVSCASTEMLNVSPEKVIPIVADFETIDASIKVTCSDPFISANEDVANYLDKEEVFRSVAAISSKDTLSASDVELLVAPKIIEDSHDRAEMGKAVFRGLLLGIADGAFADEYDYTVVLKAILKKGPRIIGTYKATGE